MIMRISPKLSEIDVCLPTYQETQIGIQASQFRICHQIRDQEYGFAIFAVSGSALCALRLGFVMEYWEQSLVCVPLH